MAETDCPFCTLSTDRIISESDYTRQVIVIAIVIGKSSVPSITITSYYY